MAEMAEMAVGAFEESVKTLMSDARRGVDNIFIKKRYLSSGSNDRENTCQT